MVIPKDRPQLVGLMAFLASTFVAGWIDESVPDRNISTKNIREIPVPPSPIDWLRLGSIGRRLLREPPDQKRADLLEELDAVVWQSLRIETLTRESVERRFAGFLAPDGVVRYAPSIGTTERRAATPTRRGQSTFGATRNVRPQEAQIVVVGITDEEGSWMRPPPAMSGWMLRAGSTFNAELSADEPDINEAHFSYQAMSWLDDEELESQIHALDQNIS
jgi:hypothetical protein